MYDNKKDVCVPVFIRTLRFVLISWFGNLGLGDMLQSLSRMADLYVDKGSHGFNLQLFV